MPTRLTHRAGLFVAAALLLASQAVPAQAAGGGVLPLPPAIDLVRVACKGSYATPGACSACAARVTQSLARSGLLTPAVAGRVTAFFATRECRDRCVPTTCAIEFRTCGALADGCGTTLVCGDPCSSVGGPNQVGCFCNDGTEQRICATLDCGSGIAQDEICG